MSSAAAARAAATRPATRTPLWPIALAGLAVAALVAATLARHGSDAAGLELLNRLLARLGFVVFVPIYLASSLRTLAPSATTRGLLRLRRSLGLAYALVMGAHAVAIVAWFATPEIPVEANLFTLGGGLGLIWIAALAATSSDAAVRRLGGRAWRRLHAPAIHYLWIVYAFTYGSRIAEGRLEYAPGALLVAALPLARVAARRRSARTSG